MSKKEPFKYPSGKQKHNRFKKGSKLFIAQDAIDAWEESKNFADLEKAFSTICTVYHCNSSAAKGLQAKILRNYLTELKRLESDLGNGEDVKKSLDIYLKFYQYYMEFKNTKDAFHYIRKAIDLARKVAREQEKLFPKKLYYREALKWVGRALEHEPENSFYLKKQMQINAEIADVYLEAGNYPNAVKYYEMCLESEDKSIQLSARRGLIICYEELGQSAQDSNEKTQYWEMALKAANHVFNVTNSSESFQKICLLSIALHVEDSIEQKILLHKDLLEQSYGLNGEDKWVFIGKHYGFIASLYKEAGRFDEAYEAYGHAVTAFEKIEDMKEAERIDELQRALAQSQVEKWQARLGNLQDGVWEKATPVDKQTSSFAQMFGSGSMGGIFEDFREDILGEKDQNLSQQNFK